MKRTKMLAVMLAVLFTMAALVGCGQQQVEQLPADQDGVKKAILVVSFGTSYPEALENCIEAMENTIAESFKDYEVRRAFTSKIIVKKLAERDDLKIDNPEQALTKLKEEGFQEVIVQPLHIIPGLEYEGKIVAVVDKFKDEKAFKKIALGRPLLTSEKDPDDYQIAVNALKGQLPELNEHQAVLLMGHGTEHQANVCYHKLQDKIKEMGLPVFIGTVEADPTLDDLIEILQTKNINSVVLMPYMLVAGDHAQNDLAGDDEDSWKSQLEKEGFEVEVYMHGLGENSHYRDIYVQHVKDAIARDRKSVV